MAASQAVTESSLTRFCDWMVRRGRSPDTATQYASKIRLCAGDGRGLTGRLTHGKLAPKTRRQNLAALRAWARFTRDNDLRDELDDLKLPPPERVVEKRPLSEDQWAAMLEAVEDVEMDDVKRAACEMILVRGFRVGDVCRLTREAVTQAIATGVLIYPGKSGRQIPWEAEPFMGCLEVFAARKRWGAVRDLISPAAHDDSRQRAARLALQRLFNKIALVAEVDEARGPHQIRRTYATGYLAEVGGNIVALQKHMGWASLATAQSYVDHSERAELDAVAERMRSRVRRKS